MRVMPPAKETTELKTSAESQRLSSLFTQLSLHCGGRWSAQCGSGGRAVGALGREGEKGPLEDLRAGWWLGALRR